MYLRNPLRPLRQHHQKQRFWLVKFFQNKILLTIENHINNREKKFKFETSSSPQIQIQIPPKSKHAPYSNSVNMWKPLVPFCFSSSFSFFEKEKDTLVPPFQRRNKCPNYIYLMLILLLRVCVCFLAIEWRNT